MVSIVILTITNGNKIKVAPGGEYLRAPLLQWCESCIQWWGFTTRDWLKWRGGFPNYIQCHRNTQHTMNTNIVVLGIRGAPNGKWFQSKWMSLDSWIDVRELYYCPWLCPNELHKVWWSPLAVLELLIRQFEYHSQPLFGSGNPFINYKKSWYNIHKYIQRFPGKFVSIIQMVQEQERDIFRRFLSCQDPCSVSTPSLSFCHAPPPQWGL